MKNKIFLFFFLLSLISCGDDTKLFMMTDQDAMAPDASFIQDAEMDAQQPDVISFPEHEEPDAGFTIVPLPEQPNELMIRLLWDVNNDQTTDVDLHLLHPEGSFWFIPLPDCYFANKEPLWDHSSTASALLDRDVTDGHGPETITILHLPDEETGKPYRVGVHYYSAHGQGPSTVYLQVFCRGSFAQFGPVTLHEYDLWRVLDIVYHPGYCIFTPVTTADGGLDLSRDRSR